LNSDVQTLDQIRVDTGNLYREETFTDLRVGTIKRLTPVQPDGSQDMGRAVVFIAQTQLMSQVGPLPVQARLEATSLSEAIEKFPAAIQDAVEQLMAEAREMQRQEMSRIVVPGAETTSKIIGGK
jgi:hypothetical protein